MNIDLKDTSFLYFMGDLHGNFDSLKKYLRDNNIINSIIVICGDIGIGFNPKYEFNKITDIEGLLVELNSYIIAIRGNHDNPFFFNTKQIYTTRFILVSDYTIVSTKFGNILCIGGAVSVDRVYRVGMPNSYWPDEIVTKNFDLTTINYPITIVVSHSAPYGCWPFTNSSFLDKCLENDEYLAYDIYKERTLLSNIFEELLLLNHSITHWYYGHYHNTAISKVKDTTFQLLNIFQLKEHRLFEYDNIEM